MEKIDYNRLPEIFQRYGCYPAFDIETDTRELGFHGMAMQLSGPTTIKMNAIFHSPRGFDQFTKDMIRLEEIADEEYLRRRNPALQQAWEEYQIILKLTR